MLREVALLVTLFGGGLLTLACDSTEKDCAVVSATVKTGAPPPEHPEWSASRVKDAAGAAASFKTYSGALKQQIAEFGKAQFGNPRVDRYVAEYRQVAADLADKGEQVS